MSDERWARLMSFWRKEPGSVGIAVEELQQESATNGDSKEGRIDNSNSYDEGVGYRWKKIKLGFEA